MIEPCSDSTAWLMLSRVCAASESAAANKPARACCASDPAAAAAAFANVSAVSARSLASDITRSWLAVETSMCTESTYTIASVPSVS